MSDASPSPSGRRWREAPDEGEPDETFRRDHPHPPLRGTLSRRERDPRQNRSHFRPNVETQTGFGWSRSRSIFWDRSGHRPPLYKNESLELVPISFPNTG